MSLNAHAQLPLLAPRPCSYGRIKLQSCEKSATDVWRKKGHVCHCWSSTPLRISTKSLLREKESLHVSSKATFETEFASSVPPSRRSGLAYFWHQSTSHDLKLRASTKMLFRIVVVTTCHAAHVIGDNEKKKAATAAESDATARLAPSVTDH